MTRARKAAGRGFAAHGNDAGSQGRWAPRAVGFAAGSQGRVQLCRDTRTRARTYHD